MKDRKRMDVQSLRSMPAGERISTTLLVCASSQRTTSSGSPYVAMTLGDESGEIEARCWDTDCGDDGPPPAGTVLEVGAKTSSYKGQAQLTIDRWEVLGEADLSGLVPSSYLPGPEIRQALVAELPGLLGDELYAVIETAMELADGLDAAPAARGNHHARMGGLIEHIDSMVYLVCAAAGHYRRRYEYELRLDLVIAAVVLHDIGKTIELSGPVGTEYTTRGRLVGHIAYGLLLLERAHRKANVELDDDTVMHLRHLILSHHGRKEWGSPVEPKTPEAVLLHQVDMIDSRMDAVLTAASSAGESEEWVRARRQSFYVGHQGEK